MQQPKNTDLRLAVLIDADNVPAKAINVMMVEIANYGKPTIKRIYGDFPVPAFGCFPSAALNHPPLAASGRFQHDPWAGSPAI